MAVPAKQCARLRGAVILDALADHPLVGAGDAAEIEVASDGLKREVVHDG